MSWPVYLKSIHHDGSQRYIRRTHSEMIQIGDEIIIRLRSGKDAPIQRIFLRICPDGEQFMIELQAEENSDPSSCKWWSAALNISMPVTNYRFLLILDDLAWWYNGVGFQQHVPTDTDDFRILANYSAPDWVRDSVFYQIFPDRYADGDPNSNINDGDFEYQGLKAKSKNWGEKQGNWPEAMVEFYGGDLQGVEAHLDYLSDLGVNAIYFNPIFSALSNHRYDVIDYFNVDPHLGGNAALISLRRATEARAMRLIVDIVPNHCGWEHDWFKSAQKDPSFPTAEFFTFHHHPDDYECWLGVRSLPKLNYRSQGLREVIYAGKDSVFRTWLKAPYFLDGWRVDVANMLARHGKDQLETEVWDGIRRAVKEENPTAYLLGENFFDGSSQLQGDKLDATMNYSGFTKPIVYWLSGFVINLPFDVRPMIAPIPWSTQALVNTWEANRAEIPWVIACQQFNLLDSHDTARIINTLGDNPNKLRLAVAFLLTYVGVPCIYYGDEIGMHGADSLEARDCMNWDSGQWDTGLLEYFKKLIKLRRTSTALINGGFQILLVDENVLAFMRDTEESQLIVVGNRGSETCYSLILPVDQAAIPDGCVFIEILSGQSLIVANGNLILPELLPGAQIWQSQTLNGTNP